MSRHSDVGRAPSSGEPLPLPVVDWARLGHKAPVVVMGEYAGPTAPLPKADVAVLTWTSAEWSALDHVFLNSQTTRSAWSRDWEHGWYLYTRSADGKDTDNPGAPLWGRFRVVEITTQQQTRLRVLLFKCDAHLAHPPWIDGLVQMIQQILDDTQAAWIYSIGTAGGSRENLKLGDVVVTNAGHIELKNENNVASPINHQTFQGDAFPATDLFADVEKQLFFRMSSVVTTPALEKALDEVHEKVPESAPFTVADFLNAPLAPANLGASSAVPLPGEALLTTDYYFIASGSDAAKWSVLEMDDAVIAYVAGQMGRKYAFVRNISDPLVPNQTPGGQAIPDSVRDGWSGQIYKEFGLYTSFNGALTTWAALAAQKSC